MDPSHGVFKSKSGLLDLQKVFLTRHKDKLLKLYNQQLYTWWFCVCWDFQSSDNDESTVGRKRVRFLLRNCSFLGILPLHWAAILFFTLNH